MKIADIGPYEVHLPTSGGKAGKGLNRTSTLQVRRDGSILKQFRFAVADFESRKIAVQKAKDFIIAHARSLHQRRAMMKSKA
jgi:hypothetical protein